MKNVSKLLSILLCLAMVIGIFTMAVGAATDHVVINEAYGGGGNSGATHKHDFVELYNPTSQDVSLAGWSIQYASKTGSFSTSNTYTFASGAKIKAGGYFLIKMASGSGGTDQIPSFDATCSINMSGSEFKLALVSNSETISGKSDTDVVDFLGVGGANEKEGSATAPKLDNTHSASRKADGVDTDNNSADFEKANLSPRNSTYGSSDPSISLNKSSADVEKGKTLTLTATTANIANPTVTWTSSNESVATVANGVVTGVSAGTATITATAGSVSAECTVNVYVKETEPGKIVDALYALESGKSLPYTVTLTGVVTEITEAYSSFKNITLTIVVAGKTDKPVVCYRMKDTNANKDDDWQTVVNSLVGRVKVGDTITVTGTLTNYSGTFEFTTGATLDSIGVTSVTLPATEGIVVGADKTLTATVNPDYATNKTVTWTSSNPSVATVDNAGKVTAVAVGTTTITATVDGKSATCTVTVTANTVNVTGVTLDKTTVSVEAGKATTLTATVTPTNATNKNVTWTSSNTAVATVDNTGKVTAVAAGTATITVTTVDGSKTATCTVTVTAPPAPPVSTAEGKVTSLDKLVTGTYVLVVDTGYAPSALDGSWITAAKPTIADGKVTDAKGAVLTLTVKDGKVTIKDANGKFIAPKGGNSNGITEGEYQWVVTFKDGKFIFAGADADTVYLASNPNGDFENKFRGYKVTTCEKEADENNPLGFPYQFTVYGVNSGNTGSGDSGNTDSGNTGSGDSGNTDSGNTDSGNSGSTTPSTPVKPSAPVWTVQDAPKTGVSFKYGLNQKGLEKQLWFTGAMDGYYLAMSEDIKDAVDVVVETVEGGYRLAFTKEGVKKYIDIVERTDKAGSANVVITDEPTAVLTWDATAKTFFAKIGENTFYLGTYNTFKTISASNISYITGDNASKVDVSQYVSHLYLDTASSTGDAFEPMVIVLALAAVSALAVLALNKKKFSF